MGRREYSVSQISVHFNRELLENLIAPKPKRLSAANHDELTKLLLAKDAELQSALSLAGEQGEIEKKIRGVQEELERQDAHIGQLQKQLKDAETLLSTSIYQVQNTVPFFR